MSTTQDVMTIKIGDGTEKDLSYYNMELISSPEAFGGEIKPSNIIKVDFPEEDGDVFYIPPNPSIRSREYKVRLAYKQQGSESVSSKVIDFMNDILGKEVTIKNKFKGTKLTGYPHKYTDSEYTKDRQVAIFDLTLYVPSGKIEAL